MLHEAGAVGLSGSDGEKTSPSASNLALAVVSGALTLLDEASNRESGE